MTSSMLARMSRATSPPGDSEGNRGKDEVAEVIDGVGESPRAQGGQPLQPHGEDEEEGEANDKGPPAQEEDRNGTEDAVEEAIGTPYGDDAEGHADEEGEDDTRGGEHERVRKNVRDNRPHRSVAVEVLAEVAVESSRQEVPELDVDGLVQAKLIPDLSD